ncbi:MAG: hypothetical protein V1853_03985 [bacterium]
MNGDALNPSPQKPRSMTWIWFGLIAVVLIIAGLAYYYATNKSAANDTITNTTDNPAASDTNVNPATSNTNQSVATNATFTNTDTAIKTQDLTKYHSLEFGYTVEYAEQDNYTYTSTSNTRQNIYNEWTLYSDSNRLAVIQVIPADKKEQVFFSLDYRQLDETEELGSKLIANKLTIGNQNKGYTFVRGSFLFTVFTDSAADMNDYLIFTEIAKTLSFSG